MSPLLRQTLARPRSVLREAWHAVRQRRIAHPLFVRPGEAWSYSLDEPHAATRHDNLAAWCAEHPQCNAYVVVSGHATHEVVVNDASLPLSDDASVVAWAAQQLVRHHGAAAQNWPVAPWRAGGRHGATAIHGLDLQALQDAARTHAVRLRAVQSWWPVALAAGMRQLPEARTAGRFQLFIAEGRLLTRVACSAGAVLDIEQHWLRQPDLPALRKLLGGLAPSAGAGAGASLLLGYGIEEAPAAAIRDLPVRTLGALDGSCPAYQLLVP